MEVHGWAKRRAGCHIPPASDFDLEQRSLGKIDNSTEKVISVRLRESPIKGRLTASLLNGADGLRLVILNGYDYPVGYEAELMVERNGKRIYHPASVCPVRAGDRSRQSWAEPAVGIALTGFHAADPKTLACSADSLLTVSPPEAGSDRFACVGGETPSKLAPFTVTPSGELSSRPAGATWFYPGRSRARAGLMIEYGMMGRDVMPAPVGLDVLAVVGLTPPPKAKAAGIVLLLGGTEKARRPWQMYARSVSATPDPTKTPAAFVGVVRSTQAAVTMLGWKKSSRRSAILAR